MKNKKYAKKILLLYLTFFISILLIPNLKVKAETINPAEWIKNNWLNYPNDTGQWTTNSINGNPALGSTKNVNWTGYLNTFAMDTKDAVFEFKMYQNENADDDNMGWTFRHNYNDVDNRGTLSTYYQFDDKTQQLIWTKEQNGSPQPFNLSLSIPSDIKYGNHTLTVWAKDSENAESQKQVINFFVKDINRPNVTHSIVNGTNNTKTININATDSESGVKRIKLPNGTYVNGDKATFTVSSNNTYEFVAEDYVGNIFTKSIVVQNIDKVNPTVTYTKEIASNKLSGFININLSDIGSGIDYLVLPDNTKVYNVSNYKYPIDSNGYYGFSVYDKVGNKTNVNIEVNELSNNINPSGIDRIEYKLEGATVQNWTVYDSPFVITNEGITTIRVRAYDKAGNLSDEKVSTAKIDKTKPINNSIIIKLK